MSTITIPKILANFETSLAATMSAAATTLTLNASVDGDGTTLSGLYSLTLDEGTSSEEHMLVTMTGASGAVSRRGLSRVDAFTEVTANKKVHSRGASVKVTNVSAINIQRLLNGDDTFNSVAWTGVASITGLSTPTSGEITKAANIDYVNGVALAGAVDATTAIKGITKMSVAPASATAPISVGDNDPRVPTTGQTTLLAAITASAAELNTLDGYTGTTADLNEMSAIVQATNVTGAELETLTGGAASDADALHIHKNSPTLVGYSVTTAANNTKTITIPANTLKTNGMIKATFSFVYSAHDLAVTFGGTSVGTFNASGVYEVVVIQTSTGNQTSSAYKQGQTNTPTQTALTKDMTASQNFVFQVSTSGTLYSLTVEVAHSI